VTAATAATVAASSAAAMSTAAPATSMALSVGRAGHGAEEEDRREGDAERQPRGSAVFVRVR
jgi:hypothetical protein